MNIRCDINASCVIDGDYIYGIFESNSSIKSVEIIGNIEKIPSFCFYNCTELDNVSIYATIYSIGNMAFALCSKLKNISIPISVKSIGYGCFTNCKSLENIILPNHLKKIQKSSFYECSNLKSIKFSDSLEEISNNAFSFCSKLINIELPPNLKSIKILAFGKCSSLTNIIIPDTVVELDITAFMLCENLQRIQLPINVVAKNQMLIDWEAFPRYCIIHYKFKKNDTKILPLSYYKNQRLTEINLNKIFFGTEVLDLPENLISIEMLSFYHCSNLEKVTLPASVKLIGRQAFYYCGKLSTIICNTLDISLSFQSLPESITIQFPEPQSGYKAYEYSGQQFIELTIPSNIIDLPPFCYYRCSFGLISQNSIKKIGTYCFANAEMTEIDLSGVEIIGDCAFANSLNLERVIFSDSLKMIGKYAFASCKQLRTLDFNIHHSIELQEGAFCSCDGLNISSILSKIEYIPDNCFENLVNVHEITIPSCIEFIGDYSFIGLQNTNSLIIEEGVKNIGNYNFLGINITSIILPNSLVSIGDYCFYSCNNLKSVKFGNQINRIPDYSFWESYSLETIEITGIVTYYGDSFILGSQMSTLKVPSNSYFGSAILEYRRTVEIIEFGKNCFISPQTERSGPNIFKELKFGDNISFAETLKAEKYYYTGSEKNDYNMDGSIFKMISSYAESVYVPNSYLASTFCGKPIVYYSADEYSQQHKLDELKRKLKQIDYSLKQKRNKIRSINEISFKTCIISDMETVDKKQFEQLKFNPKKSILSLSTTIF